MAVTYYKKESYDRYSKAAVGDQPSGTVIAARSHHQVAEAGCREGSWSDTMVAGQDDDLGSAPERRAHRRLDIRLPVECRKEGEDVRHLVRTITQNVSSGGMYIEMDAADFQPGDRLRVVLTIPPAEGVSVYQGRASCVSEVIRILPMPDRLKGAVQRFGIAARFLDQLRLSY